MTTRRRRERPRPGSAAAPRFLLLLLLAAAGVVPASTSARADAIPSSRAAQASTIAEVFVDRDGVRVELEIGSGDVGAFRNLMPHSIYERFADDGRPADERVAAFFAEQLVVAPADGEPMRGGIVDIGPRKRVVRDLLTGEPQPTTGDEETVVAAVLRYEWDERPRALSIHTALPARASIGFVAYHDGVAVNDFRYLAPTVTLDLDWDDPWYSEFRSRSLRRRLYAPFHAFLYVDPFEVRKEIILRPRDLQRWVDLGIDGADVIPAESQPEMLRRIADFLRTRQAVVIDGRSVEPELLRASFLRRTLRASTVIDPPEDLPSASATVGVIFAYAVPGMPQHATMEWDLFDERVQTVPVASVDPAGPLAGYVDERHATLEWTNYLKFDPMPQTAVVGTPPAAWERATVWARWPLAVAALAWLLVTVLRARSGRWRAPAVGALLLASVTAGAFAAGRRAVMTEERARSVVGGLLHNVYRAFDFREQEKVYDLLARSVHGDLLTSTYLETRRSLEVRNQGGARVRVSELEVIDIAVEPAGEGFRARTRWNVAGSVGHWGHLHRRSNRYLAEVEVQPTDGAWRLVSLEVLEEERL